MYQIATLYVKSHEPMAGAIVPTLHLLSPSWLGWRGEMWTEAKGKGTPKDVPWPIPSRVFWTLQMRPQALGSAATYGQRLQATKDMLSVGSTPRHNHRWWHILWHPPTIRLPQLLDDMCPNHQPCGRSSTRGPPLLQIPWHGSHQWSGLHTDDWHRSWHSISSEITHTCLEWLRFHIAAKAMTVYIPVEKLAEGVA